MRNILKAGSNREGNLFPGKLPGCILYSVKIFTARAAGVLLAAFALAGCVRDDLNYGCPAGTTQALVEFSVRVPGNSLPSSRALTWAQETEIATVDILAFDGNQFLYHIPVPDNDIVFDDTQMQYKFKVNVPKSSSDVRFVFLANAAGIIENKYGPGEITGNYSYDDIRQGLVCPSDVAWDTDAFTPLPMWGEDKFKADGSVTSRQIWLIRMLAKINVACTSPDFELEEVYLYNPMGKGYLIPDPANWNNAANEMKATAPSIAGLGNRLITQFHYGLPTGVTALTNCIYTFEAAAGDPTDISKNTFLVVGGRYGNGPKTWFRIDVGLQSELQPAVFDYLPLLRNHSYNFTIKSIGGAGYTSPDDAATAGPANVEVELDVQNDYELRYYAWDGQYFLGTEDKEFEYECEAKYNILIKVKTDYPGGWNAVASDSDTDPNAGVADNWLVLKSPMGQGYLEYDLAANDSEERTAYIHITAGRLSLVITIVQAEDDNPLRGLTLGTTLKYPELTYVGAFWRNEQTGERLIRIPVKPGMDGKWLAMVVSSTATNPPSNVIDAADTWIRLDGDPSGDGDLWQDGREPADMYNSDHIYRLPDDADTWVKGDAVNGGYIYFRIGLTDALASGAAPQYGVVRLYYNDYTKYQDIFIRHGHDADYLMRPGDGSGNGALSSRPNAKRYSPYNLTSEEYFPGPSQKTGGTNISGHSQIGTRATGSNNAAFTEYPTQAGAYFQWANATYPRYAWHPTYVSGNIPWNSNYPNTNNDYWDGANNLRATHETCPPGYRRPNDGATNAAEAGTAASNILATSEQRQSLWWDPVVSNNNSDTNVMWGYYADGFFDRYNIVTSQANTGAQANSAVCVNDYRVAYIGQLFYNPENNASLFFPAAGYRTLSNGQLESLGGYGYFWSSSANNVSYGWYLYVNQNGASQTNHVSSFGFSVRCVVDE